MLATARTAPMFAGYHRTGALNRALKGAHVLQGSGERATRACPAALVAVLMETQEITTRLVNGPCISDIMEQCRTELRR